MPTANPDRELIEISFIDDRTRVQVRTLATAAQRKLLDVFENKQSPDKPGPQAFQVLTVFNGEPSTASDLVKTIHDAATMSSEEPGWGKVAELAQQLDAKALVPGVATTVLTVGFIWETDSEDDNLFEENIRVDLSSRASKALVKRFTEALEKVADEDIYDFGAEEVESIPTSSLAEIQQQLSQVEGEEFAELKAVIAKAVALEGVAPAKARKSGPR